MKQDEYEQLSLFGDVSDTIFLSLTDCVSDRKSKAIQRFLNNGKDLPIAHVNVYSPGRRVTEYYRLSYRLGNRTKHIHIPGGNISTLLAQNRAKELHLMISRGAELIELLAVLEDWKK